MSSKTYSFLNLPRELRDEIYSQLYSNHRDHYVSYRSAWSLPDQKAVPERSYSPFLTAALSLNLACKQLHQETKELLDQAKQHLTVHFQVLNREDAAAFTLLASNIQRLYPTLSTLRITWNISGEYTSILELIPRHMYRIKALEIECIDRLNTPRFFRDAHTLAATRVNGSFVYMTKTVGSLVLKETRHIVDGKITTGVYHSAYVLRFEPDD
ncbi:hypothetical protein BLS_006005 [Venturia inaequalis]|uniref:Uncharacterized protein n=1 Tax=Venturia inaequalis TaxID=5025 RepID=A0A8H3YS53_VENIN|nr:hypothetical protein BLS_006005 [Venturia inaequalis]